MNASNMKSVLFVLMACCFVSAAEPDRLFEATAVYPPQTKEDLITWTKLTGALTSLKTTITFQHGKGWIKIDGDTGKITFKDCKPEGSGEAFWRAVMKAHPEIKKAFANCPCCGK